MNALVIERPRLEVEGERATFAARIRTPQGAHEVWFRGPRAVMAPRGSDPFLVLCLTTAMKLGLPLVVEGDVSPRLLAGADTAQDIFAKWYPDLRRVPIESTPRAVGRAAPAAGAGAFFSGGLDAFYTARKHLDSLTALVFVHGFDVKLDNAALRARVMAGVSDAAAMLGKPLLEFETNGRSFTDLYTSWPDHQFGPAMASVAMLLNGTVGKLFIASSEPYTHLDPCGSHPLLDPLWSTEDVTLVHDGAEASRIEKAAAIADLPAAQRCLRVCWENPGNAYNCGRCEKCLRTMINLEVVGARERFPVFDAPLDAAAVAAMTIPTMLVCHHVEANLCALRERGGRGDLVAALEVAWGRFRAPRVVAELQLLSDLSPDTPGLGAAVQRHGRAFESVLQPLGPAPAGGWAARAAAWLRGR